MAPGLGGQGGRVGAEPRAEVSGEMEQRVDELHGIRAVAALTGVSERTLRYYEEIGLLTPRGHSPGGMRRYCNEDIDRVRRIRELQNLMGFDLEEIRGVLAAESRLSSLRQDFRSTTDSDRQREVLDEALGALDELRGAAKAKIEALENFLADLDERFTRHRRKLDALGEAAGSGSQEDGRTGPSGPAFAESGSPAPERWPGG